MRKAIKATLLVLIAIGVGVGVVYAAAWGNHNPGGNINLWGTNDNTLAITTNSSQSITDQNCIWLDTTYVALASDQGGEPRAAFLITRNGDENATALMEGSGGGKVLCNTSGDVIITLGN